MQVATLEFKPNFKIKLKQNTMRNKKSYIDFMELHPKEPERPERNGYTACRSRRSHKSPCLQLCLCLLFTDSSGAREMGNTSGLPRGLAEIHNKPEVCENNV